MALTDPQRLAVVRAVHTAIYIVMAVSTFILVYAGLTGAHGPWLWAALVLLGIESVVFAGSGMKCPLTGLAVRYGARKGYAFDTFLPERATRYTFRFFGTVMAVGLVLLAVRWLPVAAEKLNLPGQPLSSVEITFPAVPDWFFTGAFLFALVAFVLSCVLFAWKPERVPFYVVLVCAGGVIGSLSNVIQPPAAAKLMLLIVSLALVLAAVVLWLRDVTRSPLP